MDNDKLDYLTARANTILQYCARRRIFLTPLKLQKLMYFDYGLELIDGGNAEHYYMDFEAWQHGPVIPLVYHELKHWGENVIKKMLLDSTNKFYVFKIESYTKEMVYEYARLSAWDLVELTHSSNGAWIKAYDPNNPGNPIDHVEIKNEFRRR